MQQCPKCASSVPDGRTTCQICSAELDPAQSKAVGPTGLQTPVVARPLAEEEPTIKPGIPGIDRPSEDDDVLAKQIGGAQPAASGGVELRRTLAGDVIEVPVAAPSRPGGPLAGDAAHGPGPRPLPRQGGPGGGSIPPLRSGKGPVRAVESDSGGSGSKLGVVLLVLLLLIGGGGAGGYWYWQQTRPAAAATLFFETFQQKKWGELYDQVILPDQVRSMVSRDMFERVMGAVGAGITVKSFKVESTKIEGDTATVKVSVSATIGGKDSNDTSDVMMKKVDGVWKVDGTAAARSVPGLKLGP
ncbi:MAG: hypothetical protein GX446_10490 [Chthonomonadales bacterium]|nr:hypothetical protein [Chthonomonadales bacterium]